MEVNNKELEIIESICKNDFMYMVWSMTLKHNDFLKNVEYPLMIWTEAIKLITELKKEQHDKCNVYKAWNNGVCDDKSIAVMDTSLFLLENRDCYFCNITRDKLKEIEAVFLECCVKANIDRSLIKTQDRLVRFEMSYDGQGTNKTESAKTDLEKVKKTMSYLLDICPDDNMGLSATMTIVSYYSERYPNKLGTYIQLIEERMKATWNKKPQDRCDIKCPFDDAQVESSGIHKEAKIVLAVMNEILKGEYKKRTGEKYSDIDFAVCTYAVLSRHHYWELDKEKFTKMLGRLFNVNVLTGTVSTWIRRYGINYNEWYKGDDGKELIASRRKKLANDFAELIDKVKAYKLKEMKG